MTRTLTDILQTARTVSRYAGRYALIAEVADARGSDRESLRDGIEMAYKAGLVQLAGENMPQTMDARDLADSTIHDELRGPLCYLVL